MASSAVASPVRDGPTAQLLEPAYGCMNACGPSAPFGPSWMPAPKNARACANSARGTLGRRAVAAAVVARARRLVLALPSEREPVSVPTFGKPSIVGIFPTGARRMRSREMPLRAKTAAPSPAVAASNVSRNAW